MSLINAVSEAYFGARCEVCVECRSCVRCTGHLQGCKEDLMATDVDTTDDDKSRSTSSNHSQEDSDYVPGSTSGSGSEDEEEEEDDSAADPLAALLPEWEVPDFGAPARPLPVMQTAAPESYTENALAQPSSLRRGITFLWRVWRKVRFFVLYFLRVAQAVGR